MRCVFVQQMCGFCGTLFFLGTWCDSSYKFWWFGWIQSRNLWQMEFEVYWFLKNIFFLFKHRTFCVYCSPITTTFPEIFEIHVFRMHPSYIYRYAFQCCSTDIHLYCNLPGHCSHLISYSDPLEEHNGELDRLTVGAAAWCSLMQS